MGQKSNPNGLRLGIIKDWDCNWFTTKDYSTFLYEDFQIRNFVKSELYSAGVSRILINRKKGNVELIISVARPGVIFGKKGKDIKQLKDILSKLYNKNFFIRILDGVSAEADPKLVAEWISFQIERRSPFRKAMKTSMQRALKAGAKGIKVQCSGRLGGIEIARKEWFKEGKVPLQTLRANVSYAFSEALTTYGKIGIKVWIYYGEILDSNNLKENKQES